MQWHNCQEFNTYPTFEVYTLLIIQRYQISTVSQHHFLNILLHFQIPFIFGNCVVFETNEYKKPNNDLTWDMFSNNKLTLNISYKGIHIFSLEHHTFCSNLISQLHGKNFS